MNENKCVSLAFLKKQMGNAEAYSVADVERVFDKGLEIIRCKDCRYSLWESDSLRACQKFCQFMPSTGYCFKAERKPDEK